MRYPDNHATWLDVTRDCENNNHYNLMTKTEQGGERLLTTQKTNIVKAAVTCRR